MSDFWQSQIVLITGANGFIGKHLVKYLKEKGANLYAPHSHQYNLVKSDEIDDMFRAYKSANMVIHLGAYVGGIGSNKKRPADFLYINNLMNTLVLDGAFAGGIPKFVGIGSVCAYPAVPPHIPFVEDDIWDGYPEPTNAPYGLTKRMLLAQSQAYRAQYGYNAIHLIPTNMYGEGDNFDPETSHVIPALIRKFVEAKETNAPFVEVWGTGTATREFLYVDDAVRAIALAAEHYNSGEPVNIGSGSEIGISNLAWMVARLVGYDGEIRYDASKPDGQKRRALDNSRARAEFGFYASTPLETGLKRTIEWYMNNR